MKNIPDRHRRALRRREAREAQFESAMASAEDKLIEAYAHANPGYVVEPGAFGQKTVVTFDEGETPTKLVRELRRFGGRTRSKSRKPVVETYHGTQRVAVAVFAREGSQSAKTATDWVERHNERETDCEYTLHATSDIPCETAKRYFEEQLPTRGRRGTIRVADGDALVFDADERPDISHDIAHPETEGRDTPELMSDEPEEAGQPPVGHPEDLETISDAQVARAMDQLSAEAAPVYRVLCRLSNDTESSRVERDQLVDAYYADGGELPEARIANMVTDILMEGLAYEPSEDTLCPIPPK